MSDCKPVASRWHIPALFCALALVVAFDFWLATAHPLAKAPVASIDRSEIFQSARSYEQAAGAPDVVLFGSSLMTAPVLQSEALYLGKPIPKFVHRRVHVLEESLARSLGRTPEVFCLAAGGEMASDAYLITKNLLRGAKQPIAIIYGVAPRDFQDNLVPDPEATPVFQSLATVSDLPERMTTPPVKLQKKLEVTLGRLCSLWRYRNDLRVYLTLRLKKFMERTMPWVCFEKYDDKHVLRVAKRGLYPEEAAGEPTAWPGVALDHLSPKDMLADYNLRYNPVSPRAFDLQFAYFEKFLKLTRERGIAVLIVNMPLSTANKRLMPPHFLDAFRSRCELLCKQYDVDFADLNRQPWDDCGNFVDTVHLEPRLSAHFLDEMSAIASRSQVALALKGPVQSLAETKRQKPF